jgi:hypothetical protein
LQAHSINAAAMSAVTERLAVAQRDAALWEVRHD